MTNDRSHRRQSRHRAGSARPVLGRRGHDHGRAAGQRRARDRRAGRDLGGHADPGARRRELDPRSAAGLTAARGMTTIQYVVATALSLLVFVGLANFVVDLYARGAVRSAVDEGARAGAASTRRRPTANSAPATCSAPCSGARRALGAGVVRGRRRHDAGAGPRVTLGRGSRACPAWSFTARSVRWPRNGSRERAASESRVRRDRAGARARAAGASGGAARADAAGLVGTAGHGAGHQPGGRAPRRPRTACATSATRAGARRDAWRATSACPATTSRSTCRAPRRRARRPAPTSRPG